MSSPHLHNLHRDLSKLPRLDKTQFISSYIREQKVHAKSYASEGRAFLSSWNRIASEVQASQHQTHAIQAPADFGFGTPVLKARTTEPKPHAEITNRTSQDSSGQDRVNDKPITTQGKENKRKRSSTNMLPVSKSRQQTAKSKKGNSVHSDAEQSKRLKERRERKRAKRAIVRPVEVGSQSGSEGINKRKVKKRKEEKAKVPAGFALMHGFSATNIGAGRLTVKYPVGVFNKGKASAKTRVSDKKITKAKGRQDLSFSEAAFLTEACQKQKTRRKKTSLSSSAFDADHSTADRDRTPSDIISEKVAPVRLTAENVHCVSDHETSSSASDINSDRLSVASKPTKLPQTTAARAESIVWDIELDDVSLPSLPPSDSGKHNITLDTRYLSWAGHDCTASGPRSCANQESKATTPVLKVRKLDSGGINIGIRSSPSIAPSQSASQYGPSKTLIDARTRPLALSKYFSTTQGQLRQLGSPGKPLAVGTAPQPVAGEPFHSVQTLSTAARPHPKPAPPSPTPPSFQGSEEYEVGQNCNFGVDVGMIYHDIRRDHEEFKEMENDTLLCAPMDGYDEFQPPGYEPAADNGEIINDDDVFLGGHYDTNSYLNNKASNFQVFNDAQSDFGYLDPGYSTHMNIDPDVLGQWSEAWDFEYEDHEVEEGYCNGLDENTGYSDLGSNWGYQPHNELEAIFDDTLTKDNSDCVSGGGYEMGSQVSGHGHSLAYITTRFSQGRDLLLGHLENDRLPHQIGDRLRRPVSLVEADVAKSLRNHWHPQKL